MSKKQISDYIKAHKYSINHMPELKKDHKCGCFYCMTIFDPTVNEPEWLKIGPADRRGTALCPFCGIDSVIGEHTGYPITKEFLQQMHNYWFGDGGK